MAALGWLEDALMASIRTGGGSPTQRHATHVFGVSPRTDVFRIRAYATRVVTLMEEFGLLRDRSQRQLVRDVMSEPCLAGPVEASVAVRITSPIPYPASGRLAHLRPKALFSGSSAPAGSLGKGCVMAKDESYWPPCDMPDTRVSPCCDRCFLSAAAFTEHALIVAKPRFIWRH